MSVVFYLAAILLTALAVWLIVPVILRAPDREEQARQQENVTVARQRLNELKARESAGEIDLQDAAQIRDEIESELLRDVEDLPEDQSPSAAAHGRGAKWTAIAVALFLPLATGALYLMVGEPGIVATKSQSNTASVQTPTEERLPGGDESLDLGELTKRLLEHLAQNPDDVLGWSTLGQMFAAQEQFAEAAGAYKKVRELEGDSPEYLVREADAIAMANNGVLQGQPEFLIRSALELDPEHTGALWLAGLAAGERGDVAAALNYWKQAEKTTDNSEMLAQLRGLIERGSAELARLGGETSADGKPLAGRVIKVEVVVEPTVLEKVGDEDTVFIFARAFNGPPAPLAVLKKKVKDLPAIVELDDSLAMLPNLNISSFDEVYVVARVSLSDTPQAQSGDYFGQSGPLRPGENHELVSVVISERVP